MVFATGQTIQCPALCLASWPFSGHKCDLVEVPLPMQEHWNWMIFKVVSISSHSTMTKGKHYPRAL